MKRVSTFFYCELNMGYINSCPNDKQRLAITIGSNRIEDRTQRSVLLSLETAKAFVADLEEKIKELENQ